MNSEKNGWIRYFVTALLVAVVSIAGANELNIAFEHNRFLDDQGNTIHHFNYKVPNNQLTFAESDDGYLALLDVKISSEKDGEEKVLDEFTHHIGVREQRAAFSEELYYLDKIQLTLAQSGLNFRVDFQDQLSGKQFQWSRTLENLDSNSLVSDIEFSHQILRGVEHPGLEQFLRGNYQFYVDPAHIYRTEAQDTVFFYYEIQNLYPAVDGNHYFAEEILIYSDKDTLKIENRYQDPDPYVDMMKDIPMEKLSTGYFNVEVSITDMVRNMTHTAKDYFVIAERRTPIQRLFPDNETEYRLLRYFLPSSYFRNWDEMSTRAQNNLIDRFWRQNDPVPQTEANEFLENIRQRIEYANEQFPHHSDGWETDRGRVYVRQGAPDDIVRDNIEGDIRLTRREYIVWRYHSSNKLYLFIDPQGMGSFRLIYNRNDDREQTVSNWERYVGEDFDMSILE